MDNVLGLMGAPGAGKSEVVKILVKDYNFIPINSKVLFYEMASGVTGLPQNHFIDPVLKNGEFNGIPLRRIVAEMGLAVESMFGQDYCIRKALDNYRVKEKTNKKFVVDSLRLSQPTLLSEEMHLVEVNNPSASAVEWYDKYYFPRSGHEIIQNDGDLLNLKDEVHRVLKNTGFIKT